MKEDFEIQAMTKVQDLIVKRKDLRINQIELAFRLGVSLKTIQNFENYKSLNSAYLFYGYETILNNR
jgi:DNA-binding XRE family transcriptional regulator